MENLMRIREPLAWALVGLAAVSFVLQAVQIVWYLLESVQWYTVGGGDGRLISISWIFGWQGSDHALLLALIVAVVGCWAAPAVPRARPIALTAAWIATGTVAFPWLVVALGLLTWPSSVLTSEAPWEWWMSIGLLPPLIATGVGVVAAIALWALARRPPEESEDEDEGEDEGEPADPRELDEAEEEHPTVWKPAEATGTVWRTADEAAAGAPGARSLEPGRTASPGAEWADETDPPEPGPSDDWRPPSSG